MELNHIYCGDSLGVLKDFTDKSIDCCVTSPPYYGLRDYGTGRWVGGDPDCKHESAKVSTRFERTMTDKSFKQTTNIGSDVKSYIKTCPICGAVREDKQIGLEETPEEYIKRLVDVFKEVRRVLTDDGTLWVNIGDTYNGAKQGNTETVKHKAVAETNDFKKQKWDGAKTKDLIGIPWMLAFALREDGWYLRQDIIWHKPNPMPESVKDRCTKSHEYIFLLSKQPHYYFDHEAIQEESKWGGIDRRTDKGRIEYEGKRTSKDGTLAQQSFVKITEKRNKRDVWSVATKPYKEAHFATFPEALIEPCILAGCPKGGVVLDPFFGSGTTGYVATKYNRKYVGIELNPKYIDIAKKRLGDVQMDLLAYL